MTAKELIEQLQTVEPDLQVVVAATIGMKQGRTAPVVRICVDSEPIELPSFTGLFARVVVDEQIVVLIADSEDKHD